MTECLFGVCDDNGELFEGFCLNYDLAMGGSKCIQTTEPKYNIVLYIYITYRFPLSIMDIFDIP